MLRLLALEHPAREAGPGETVDGIDRRLDDTWRSGREGAIREIEIVWRARNSVCIDIAIATDIFDDAMPDRGSASDTDRVYHRGIISVTRPDADHHIGGVANGPVIRKVISSTGFSGHFRI